MTRNTRDTHTTSTKRRFRTLNLLLFGAILVMLNLVAGNAFFKWDLTRGDAYSLSRVSTESLARLEDPLRVKVFYTADLPAPYNGIRQYLTDLLRGYDAAEDRYFSWETVDTATPEGRAEAQQYGLQQVEIQEVRSDEFQSRAVYMGAVVLYGNVVERIDRITGTDGMEYRLTTAISQAITQVDALAGSTEPVMMEVLASPTLRELQIRGFPELEAQMAAIHERVNNDNYGRITFSFETPETPAEIAAARDELGVRPLQWEGTSGAIREGLLEIVLRRGELVERIPLEIFSGLLGGYALDDPANIEDAVRRGLRSLVSATPQIAYAVGHGEKGLEDSRRGAAPFAALAGERYELLPVAVAEEGIPAGIDTLIINGPTTELGESALYRIDQFVMDGGSLLVLTDSYTQQIPTQQQQIAGAQPSWQPNATGLTPLLRHYGVEVTDAFVLDEESFTARDARGSTQIFQAPVLSGESLNRDNPITAGLQDVIVLNAAELLPARALDAGSGPADEAEPSDSAGADPGAGDRDDAPAATAVTYTPILQTSPQSWTVTTPEEIGPWTQGPPAGADLGRRDVGVLLEGTFQSYFDEPVELAVPTRAADGAEAPGAAASGTEGAADATVTVRTERFSDRSVADGRILVLSTSELTTTQMLNPQNRTPNGTFLLNALDYLNGVPEIAALRSKGLGVPRITVANPASATVARWTNVVLVPGIVVVIGVVVWQRRRRRSARIQAIFSEEEGDQV